MVNVTHGSAGMSGKFSKTDGEVHGNINNVIVYIDDLLTHSQNHEQHLESLEMVMQRLEENNMKINLSKCFFGNTEVSYLGFKLTPSAIKPGQGQAENSGNSKNPSNKGGNLIFC